MVGRLPIGERRLLVVLLETKREVRDTCETTDRSDVRDRLVGIRQQLGRRRQHQTTNLVAEGLTERPTRTNLQHALRIANPLGNRIDGGAGGKVVVRPVQCARDKRIVNRIDVRRRTTDDMRVGRTDDPIAGMAPEELLQGATAGIAMQVLAGGDAGKGRCRRLADQLVIVHAQYGDVARHVDVGRVGRRQNLTRPQVMGREDGRRTRQVLQPLDEPRHFTGEVLALVIHQLGIDLAGISF